MVQTTPRNAIPYPQLSDPPNANTAFGNMLAPIDSNSIARVATAAGISLSTAGQMAYANDKDQLFVRDANNTSRMVSLVRMVLKGSDTIRSATITATADPALTFPVAANSVYVVQGEVTYIASSIVGIGTPGIRLGFTGPTGSTHNIGIYGPTALAATAATGQPSSMGSVTPGTLLGYNSSTQSQTLLINGIVITTATAGTVTLNWAQYISSAATTTVQADSWLRTVRVS